MNISCIDVSRDELSTLSLTGNVTAPLLPALPRRYQVRIGDGPVMALTHVTADEAQAIAAAWSTLAAEIHELGQVRS